jgi:hypothetical protein
MKSTHTFNAAVSHSALLECVLFRAWCVRFVDPLRKCKLETYQMLQQIQVSDPHRANPVVGIPSRRQKLLVERISA